MGKVLQFRPKGTPPPEPPPVTPALYRVTMENRTATLYAKIFRASSQAEAQRLGAEDPSWDGWDIINREGQASHIAVEEVHEP